MALKGEARREDVRVWRDQTDFDCGRNTMATAAS